MENYHEKIITFVVSSTDLSSFVVCGCTSRHRILPDDWIAVPRNPSIEQLTSMAVRSDHGLGSLGYYDQPMFGSDISHDDRLRATITSMRQLYEEATGQGFYQLPRLDQAK
jgi:hypothetical protein